MGFDQLSHTSLSRESPKYFCYALLKLEQLDLALRTQETRNAYNHFIHFFFFFEYQPDI